MRTTEDLRQAYQHLADTAPSVVDLHIDRASTVSRTSRVRLAVAATAAVLVIAAVLAITRGGIGHRGMRPATAPVITCTSTDGDVAAARLDMTAIRARLAALGRTASISAVANGSGLRIALKSTAPVAPSTLCSSATLEARPVLAAKHASCSPSQPTPSPWVCAADGIEFELGPSVVDGSHVTQAVPLQPGLSAGSTRWTVALTLDGTGGQAWAAFTTAHNLGSRSQPPGDVTSCGRARVPCDDYVAFVVDGRVLTVPLILAPITGSVTELDAGDNESQARDLAARLNYLPVPMK